ncbi:hypothetical protein PR202_gb12883 [Eleusine coracana subsp. coracana]|uniref:Rab-GAP TBC domain-containing protein n=1 Tax=Eleusine coracana subsp. coracana TaxID=191504 RepID=A0AAV5ESP1_ELECO|nr:hypothetical protein PR202_gb12883 [Eleusine coracana subsp. coracana]
MEVTTKVYPQYYAFRWITLLLTMEFSFNVCIHIWDAILGDPEGPPDTLLKDMLCHAHSSSEAPLGWRLHGKHPAAATLRSNET